MSKIKFPFCQIVHPRLSKALCECSLYIGTVSVDFVRDRTIVNVWCPNWRALPWFTFGLLGLALSVFTWGVQYKLSLYDPPKAASHQMPEAKLLSKSERPAAAESRLLKDTKASAEMICVLVAGLFLFCLPAPRLLNATASGHRRRNANRPWYLSRRAALNAFFFRPPPTLA
jgi:hypothetical protein